MKRMKSRMDGDDDGDRKEKKRRRREDMEIGREKRREFRMGARRIVMPRVR